MGIVQRKRMALSSEDNSTVKSNTQRWDENMQDSKTGSEDAKLTDNGIILEQPKTCNIEGPHMAGRTPARSGGIPRSK